MDGSLRGPNGATPQECAVPYAASMHMVKLQAPGVWRLCTDVPRVLVAWPLTAPRI
jgi:hypothetical protein